MTTTDDAPIPRASYRARRLQLLMDYDLMPRGLGSTDAWSAEEYAVLVGAHDDDGSGVR